MNEPNSKLPEVSISNRAFFRMQAEQSTRESGWIANAAVARAAGMFVETAIDRGIIGHGAEFSFTHIAQAVSKIEPSAGIALREIPTGERTALF
jgi:hypothetical protein